MVMRIRVTMRASLFEERKRQHIARDYRIEDEQPAPVNGLSSFIAVRDMPRDGMSGQLVQEALNARRVSEGN
jgi:hypothetical protein